MPISPLAHARALFVFFGVFASILAAMIAGVLANAASSLGRRAVRAVPKSS